MVVIRLCDCVIVMTLRRGILSTPPPKLCQFIFVDYTMSRNCFVGSLNTPTCPPDSVATVAAASSSALALAPSPKIVLYNYHHEQNSNAISC